MIVRGRKPYILQAQVTYFSKSRQPDDIYADINWEENPPINGFYEVMMDMTPEQRIKLRFIAEEHRKAELERQGLTDTMNPAFLPYREAMEKYGSHHDGKQQAKKKLDRTI